MKNKVKSIYVDMLIKKFYCHKCGDLLVKNPRTRTIRRGDPDYREHSRIGRGSVIGDVELTEYDFMCTSCGKITSFDDQCVIQIIQKRVGSHTLSQAQINDHIQKATAKLNRKRKITDIIAKIIFFALVIFIMYMCFK